MKNLIFVIFVFTFFSFSFVSSNFFTKGTNVNSSYLTENIFPSESSILNLSNPKDSTEPTDSSADNPTEITSPLKDVSGMFNERGYYKSNGFSFDDQEIINDFNGNLLYSVPMYNYALGGDLNLEIKLTYNGSVGHIITTSDTVGIRYSTSVYSRRNINFPEWIIDLNGFALQTFNFETNFFTESNEDHYVQGSSVNAVITGYHYDNELGEINSDNKDKINILMGDGSTITMENIDFSGDGQNPNNYIGNYISKGKEIYYKAKVTYINTPNGNIGNNPRRVVLSKGDGIEYIFEEMKIQFDDFRTDASLVNAKIRPMAIYLTEIRDRFSHSIKISYSPNHPFPIDPNEKLKGRQLLKSITTSGISSTITNAAFWLEYGPSICKVFHQSELNGNYSIFYNTPVGYRTSDNYKNQRGTVGKINNILDQKSEFTYSTYLRRYDNLYGLYNQSVQYLGVSLNDLKRMKSSKTNLGLKRDYLEYLASDSLSIDLTTFYYEGNEKSVIGALNDYMGYGRDPFFVNMLKKKSDSLIDLKSETTFDYYYSYANRPGTNPSEDVQIHPVSTDDDYSTTRTLFSKESETENSSITSSISKKHYKVYPVFNPNNSFEISIDKNGITKLIQEDNIKSGTLDKYLSTIYSYEIGSLSSSQNGYDGSFLNKSKKVYPDNLTTFSEWNWNYVYQNNDPNKPVIQSTEYDPFGNYSITDYAVFDDSIWHKQFISDFNYNSAYIKSYYYRINLPLQEKRYSPNGTSLLKKTYTYITDTSSTLGYLGQLISEKVYKFPSFNDYIETNYEYCRNDTTGKHIFSGTGIFPYKEGNIKLTKTNDKETKYFYNPISLSEVDKYGSPVEDEPPGIPYLKFKVKYNNNTELNKNEKIWDFRFPIRTDLYKINGSSRDTLSITYKSYTLDGSPSKMIDQNKYLTQFVYEPIHRISSIILPGDFSTLQDSVALQIHKDSIYAYMEIRSDKWGQYNSISSEVYHFDNEYNYVNPFYDFVNCADAKFRMSINSSHNLYAFIKLMDNSINAYSRIDSAIFSMWYLGFDAIKNNQSIPSSDYGTYIKAITGLNGTPQDIPNCIQWHEQTAILDASSTSIDIPVQARVGCNFINKKLDLKNLLMDLNSRNKYTLGFAIYSVYSGPETNPESASFYLNFTECNNNSIGNWFSELSPRLNIYGFFNTSDTLKIPIIKGGTIKYYYDDINHKVNVYSVRNSLNNDRSRIQYAIDGYGNFKEKDIFTSNTDSNTYNYKFNYMNQPAENLDALDQYTKYSYDGIGRLIKTKNADTSSTLISYSYYNSLNYSFGSVIGVVEKQRFTDEEGNPFDKYFDAVGNLLREVKFVSIPAPEEDFPSTSLITDYKYDSLYRVTQVKTPNNKDVYYSYDGYGRQSKRITPDAGQTDFIFDNSNNLTYSQDANQRNINSFLYTFRNYDGVNRLTGIGDGMFDIDSPYDGTQNIESQPTNYYTVNVYDTISNSVVNNLFTGVSGYASTLNYTKGNLAATAYRTRKSDPWNFKYYRYDVRGRVIKMWNIISGFDTLITDYSYNSQDQVTDYSHTGKGEKVSYRNSYDYAGRLSSADKYDIPDIPNPDFINLAAYSYNPNSQVLQNDLNEGNIRIYYYYNNRGWISEMLENNGFLNYTNGYFKNGNVKSQQISGDYNDNFSVSTDLAYTYTYDKSNRLLTSDNADKIYDLTNSYDKDGNILSLVRTNGIGSTSDNFSYAYYSGTNKLQRVIGAGSQFSYDANGNLIQDAFNNNNEKLYDYRNLITELKHRSMIIGDTVYLTKYYYDEAGNRIRKMTYAYLQPITESEPPANSDVSNTSNWALRNDEVYSRDVSGRELAIYKNSTILEYPTYGLDMIGKIKDDELHFYLKDHLGSIRATIYDNKLMSAQDYDAWGYILEGRTYESEQGKFKFTGKERDEESFYDYFGARYYDARVGRWGQVEPLFDKFISFSPYSYSVLNPLKFTDILGQGPKITISGNEIDINFSIFYTTKEVDAVFGLDQTQINVLETMSQNAHEDWSGDFVIGGELYSINVNVELTLSSQPFDIFASEKQRLPGGYNLTGDFTWDPQASEQLAHERGVGMSGNVLMMLSGDDLKPYKSSGSHEAGHAMSLGHEDATSRPYRYGSKLEKIWSVMGKVTIYEGKEYREKPTSNDWSKIFERTKINLKKNQSTYINN